MATKFYPAAICKDGDGYTVQFLDLPNAFTEGDTFQHALAMAVDVLGAVLDVMSESGDKIPEPTDYFAAAAKARKVLDKDQAANLVAVLMFPGSARGKAMRVMISLEEELLKRIDAGAGHYGRSGWLAAAARDKLARDTPLPEYRIDKNGRMAPVNAAAKARHAAGLAAGKPRPSEKTGGLVTVKKTLDLKIQRRVRQIPGMGAAAKS